MEEPIPMPDLMGGSSAEIVIGCTATWYTIGQDVTAIFLECSASRICAIYRGEIAYAQETTAKVRQEIDVQGGIGAFAQRGLHRGIVVAGCPVIVGGEVCADKVIGNARWTIVLVHDVELEIETYYVS